MNVVLKKYDIPSMFIEAFDKLDKFNIMLLVKNKKILLKKMERSKKELTKDM